MTDESKEGTQEIRVKSLIAILFFSILLFASLARNQFAAIESALVAEPSLSSTQAETLDGARRPETLVPKIPAPQLQAEAYLVRIIDSHQILLEQRASKLLSPASVTKLMTALLAVEQLDPDQIITFSREDKGAGEKISDAKEGEQFLRDDVIRFALINSTNDAAYALAEAVGRMHGANTFQDAITIFVGMMNARAGTLGLTGTFFVNPAGLDAKDHTMSARDIAILMEYLYNQHQELLGISRMVFDEVRSVNGRIHNLSNTNELLKEFPAIVGSKTGLTDQAKGTLAMLYPLVNGKIAVIILLGSDDRFEDGRKIIRWLQEAF